jgi:hypothetical protein
MPHSWHWPTGIMLEHIYRLQPSSVLDIGAGLGKWGYLARDMLDFNLARLEREEWATRIDGVEGFAYSSPLHEWVYDHLSRSNILENHDIAVGYDLVILGDVIEHFEKDAGERLLASLVRQNRNVLVSTPTTFFTQAIADNPLEQHLSLWGPSDFAAYPSDVDVSSGALVVLIGGKQHVLPTAGQVRASRRAISIPGILTRGTALRLAKRALQRLPV